MPGWSRSATRWSSRRGRFRSAAISPASARSSVTVAIDEARNLHRIEDPDVGDLLYVITAAAPARGLLKSQDFVEFRALASAHGIALQPLADDLTADLSADKVVISRPGGLSISALAKSSTQALYHRHVLDLQAWGFDRQADFTERKTQLVLAAADAPEAKRLPARCDLARFYLARDMYAEAKAVLDVAVADNPPSAEDSTPMVLRAIANIMIGRPDAALKDLVESVRRQPARRAAVAGPGQCPARQMGGGARRLPHRRGGDDHAAARAPAHDAARHGAAPRSRSATSPAPPAVSTSSRWSACRASSSRRLPCSPAALAEGLGRIEDALRAYRAAYDFWDRPAAAQGRLREILLEYGRGNQDRPDAIGDLETLTTVWRGDHTEVEALQLLARLYTEEGRYRDAFHIKRTALRAHPNSDMTRRIQEEAMSTFDSLFLAGKGDALSAIDALALFYDFRELTPIGRRGDEMIRRLADRLVVGRSAVPGQRAAAAPDRSPPARRGARAGRGAAGRDLHDGPQVGERAGGAAYDAHRRPQQRPAQSTPAA